MRSSNGIIKFIRVIELKNVIKGRIYKDVLYHFLNCENILILWKTFFMKIINERQKDLFKIVMKDIFVISMKGNIILIICFFYIINGTQILYKCFR